MAKRRQAESVETGLKERKRKLDEIDRELLRLKLKNPAITTAELVRAIGLGKSQISARINEEVFQDALAYHQLSAVDIIIRAKQRAAQKFEQLIDSSVDSVARQVCESILADVLPPKNVALTHSGTVRHIHSLSDEVLLAEIEEISEELGVKDIAAQCRQLLNSPAQTRAYRANANARNPDDPQA